MLMNNLTLIEMGILLIDSYVGYCIISFAVHAHYSGCTWRGSACIAWGVSSMYLISVAGGEAQKCDSSGLIACKSIHTYII